MTPLSSDLSEVGDARALKARWQALEERVAAPFFLSWTWIGAWLAGLERPPLLLAVTGPGGADIALGLFVPAVESRRGLRVRQMRLHETGDASRDAVTVEYNSLLCDPGMEAAAWNAALRALRVRGGWDEIVASGVTDVTAATLSGLGLHAHRRAQATSAWVDLAALRERGIGDAEGYVATLSRNARGQLRRSLRLYGERGPLRLQPCTDVDAFFAGLGEHHEAKWRTAGRSGATANPAYMAFHRRMIADALPRGEVELLRASAGDEAFGWLYNFVHRGRVLFYLSGFRVEADNRLKPGLVTHALAVERHLRAGADVYDFMGGDNRYKASLGQPGPGMQALALQRRTPALLLENAARAMKARLARPQASSSLSQ